MKFISGSEIEKEIRGLLKRADHKKGSVRVAVAYWGAGAVERLKIQEVKGRVAVVFCDLMSGACNPEEVKRLQVALGNNKVLKCNRLHAKVWLTDKGAILGSSNASAAGLGLEGDETAGLVEANVFVDDPTILDEIEHWFKEHVESGSSRITKDDLTMASELWKRRRRSRPSPKGDSLIEALRNDPASFADRNLFVKVWEQDNLDDWAEKVLDDVQEQRHNSRIEGYQDWSGRMPPAGAHILDFDIENDRAASASMELCRVLTDDRVVRRKKGSLLLYIPVTRFERLPLGPRTAWADAATRAWENPNRKNGWWGAAELFARQFLQPGGRAVLTARSRHIS